MNKKKLFYSAKDVADILEISIGQAYKIIRNWNEELHRDKYLVIPGKIPASYFMSKIYGTNLEEVKHG